MTRIFTLLGAMLLTLAAVAAPLTLTSPDGHLTLTTGVDKGRPYYTLSRDGKTVVDKSHLGFVLGAGDMSAGMKVVRTARDSHDDTWTTVWGEVETIRNHYNELAVTLQGGSRRAQMVVTFRLFDDGLGFRYEIPQQRALPDITVTDELTEFTLPQDVPAWSIPTNHTVYYEGIYERDLLSRKDTVCTPLTIEAAPDLFLAIHQAALTDYADLNLTPRPGQGGAVTMLAALTPWQDGTKVKAGSRLLSPWRTVIVGRNAGDLITSHLMLNLNEPCTWDDTSWIEPGRYIGIWWSIHKKKHTWEQGPNHGATTQNMKRYIDFAARHGFSGVLAEGWNYGWGQGEDIDFLTPYPDYDLEEVTRYARERGVRVIAHCETSGRSLLLEEQMDSAFALYERLGINAIKTGYVAVKLSGLELSHSQYGVRHYRKVLECAARHHIMVDNHEPVMPTGPGARTAATRPATPPRCPILAAWPDRWTSRPPSSTMATRWCPAPALRAPWPNNWPSLWCSTARCRWLPMPLRTMRTTPPCRSSSRVPPPGARPSCPMARLVATSPLPARLVTPVAAGSLAASPTRRPAHSASTCRSWSRASAIGP